MILLTASNVSFYRGSNSIKERFIRIILIWRFRVLKLTTEVNSWPVPENLTPRASSVSICSLHNGPPRARWTADYFAIHYAMKHYVFRVNIVWADTDTMSFHLFKGTHIQGRKVTSVNSGDLEWPHPLFLDPVDAWESPKTTFMNENANKKPLQTNFCQHYRTALSNVWIFLLLIPTSSIFFIWS